MSEPSNTMPAIDKPETIEVETTRVSCDGDGVATGHPRVWLEMGEKGVVECGYCDRRFVLKKGAKPKTAH